jgi:type II secretory pathway component PulF
MLFLYKAIDKSNTPREGTVDAQNIESAIETIESRGYTVVSVDPIDNANGSILDFKITWFERVSHKEIVILSRQIATLFDAQVSALQIFRLLGSELDNPKLQRILTTIGDDLQGLLNKHSCISLIILIVCIKWYQRHAMRSFILHS